MKINDMKREYNRLMEEGRVELELLQAKHKRTAELIKEIENADPDNFNPIPLWFGAPIEIYDEDE